MTNEKVVNRTEHHDFPQFPSPLTVKLSQLTNGEPSRGASVTVPGDLEKITKSTGCPMEEGFFSSEEQIEAYGGADTDLDFLRGRD